MDDNLFRRRALRREQTIAESWIWRHLRGRRLEGLKFRRQYPCGPFILDFFCSEVLLAIELDGGQHYGERGEAYDRRRTLYINAQGIQVLRFANDQAMLETSAVLEVIRLAALARRRR